MEKQARQSVCRISRGRERRNETLLFEKADDGIKGSYNIINREFARFLKNKYESLKFINREQDLNLPGLRQAKLSYMPCSLVEKFVAKLIY